MIKSETEHKVLIKFKLNDENVEVLVFPFSRVLDVLRDNLKFTGTKEGCGEGECGACSVFMDGKLVNSCLVPAIQADKSEIQTIEGVSRLNSNEIGRLHKVQRAFIECGGTQCGICTPGMIMATISLLKRKPSPSYEEIREGLAGNLCRCTGYTKIFDSVARSLEAEGRELQ